MAIRRLTGLVCAALVLAACAANVPLRRDQLGSLTRESTPDDLARAIGKATPRAQFELQANGRLYQVRTYALVVGTQSMLIPVCTPTCIFIPSEVPVTTDFAVVLRAPEGRLHAWGTLEELSKDGDPEVSGIMPALKERLAQEGRK